MHGTAMDDLQQRESDDLFGTPLHRPDIVGDDIAEPDALPADARGLVDQRGAEDRFEAAHQPPGVTLDISLNGATTDMGTGVGLVEDRARNRDVIALERDQHRNIADNGAKRRVRRTEIQTANRHDRSENETSVYTLRSARSSIIFSSSNPSGKCGNHRNFQSKTTRSTELSIASCGVDESCRIGP